MARGARVRWAIVVGANLAFFVCDATPHAVLQDAPEPIPSGSRGAVVEAALRLRVWAESGIGSSASASNGASFSTFPYEAQRTCPFLRPLGNWSTPSPGRRERVRSRSNRRPLISIRKRCISRV